MIVKKPIIGIVGRIDKASDEDIVICTWEEMRRSIVRKGGIPLVILPTQEGSYEELIPDKISRFNEVEKQDLIEIVSLCDGLVFPGGYHWYEFDELLYQIALEKDIPILGICLGMQLMGKMDQRKETTIDNTVLNKVKLNHYQRNQKYVHTIKIKEGTLLYHIVKSKKLLVNSKHNYHIPGVKNLVISAISEDGLIEAIEDPKKTFVLGVQWHPETMLSYDKQANLIFERFIESAIFYSKMKE